MDNLQHLDPRKVELFEARFLGNQKGVGGTSPQVPRSHSSTAQNNAQQGGFFGIAGQQNAVSSSRSPVHAASHANNSVGSGSSAEGSRDAFEHRVISAPEKRPDKRQRKRKVVNEGESSAAKSTRQDGAKKIPEYFKSGASPRRGKGEGSKRNSNPEQREQNSSPHSKSMTAPTSQSMCLVPYNPSGLDSPPSVFDIKKSETTTSTARLDLLAQPFQPMAALPESGRGSDDKDDLIQDLQKRNEEFDKQLASLQRHIEKQKGLLNRCLERNKTLLIEKSNIEKINNRQKSMENRLKLGHFQTVRQGASFVENWVDGYAFQELMKRQETINLGKEDIEKQRKLLAKKKPSMKHSNAEFMKPGEAKPYTLSEFYMQDEILKLRQAALKKEDTEIAMEMEKLERSRNLHIREMKRIQNEDSSRFKDHPILNDRYLLLNLLGKGGFSEVHKFKYTTHLFFDSWNKKSAILPPVLEPTGLRT